MIQLFFWLLVGHTLADFALQNDAMAKGKNRNKMEHNFFGPRADYFRGLIPSWHYWLTAHALIHGGCVAVATGSVLLGLFEVCAHWCIDFAKCENWLGVHSDQALHLGCKLAWLLLLMTGEI